MKYYISCTFILILSIFICLIFKGCSYGILNCFNFNKIKSTKKEKIKEYKIMEIHKRKNPTVYTQGLAYNSGYAQTPASFNHSSN